MKWSKQWVAALLLVPGMYLASCGGSGNNNEGSDTLTTRSAPPADVNASTSDARNMGDSSTRAGYGGTNSASGNTNQATTSPGNELSGTTGTSSTTGTTGTGTSASESSKTTLRKGSGERARAGTSSVTKRKSSGYTSRTRRSGNTGTSSRIGTTGADRTTSTERTGDGTKFRSRLDRSADHTRTNVDADSSTTSMNRRNAMDTGSSMRHSLDTTSSSKRSGINRADSTTREDMGKVDSAGMNRNRTMDSSWKRSGNTGNTSTRDSVSSTPDSTRGVKGNISGYPGRTTMGRDTTDPAGDTTSSSMGQWKTGNGSTSGAGMNFTPSVFIRTQIENNYGEIKMARLAIEQASSSDVKNVARVLENDHNEALRELQTLAKNQSDLSGSLPTSESDSAKQHISMMRNSHGSDFDKAWVSHMHAMHEKGVRNFEMAENTITDANLKAWVSKMLPKLRDHRDRLAQLERNLSK